MKKMAFYRQFLRDTTKRHTNLHAQEKQNNNIVRIQQTAFCFCTIPSNTPLWTSSCLSKQDFMAPYCFFLPGAKPLSWSKLRRDGQNHHRSVRPEVPLWGVRRWHASAICERRLRDRESSTRGDSPAEERCVAWRGTSPCTVSDPVKVSMSHHECYFAGLAKGGRDAPRSLFRYALSVKRRVVNSEKERCVACHISMQTHMLDARVYNCSEPKKVINLMYYTTFLTGHCWWMILSKRPLK